MGNETLELEESTIQKIAAPSKGYLRVKRVFDFLCSLLALIILSAQYSISNSVLTFKKIETN